MGFDFENKFNFLNGQDNMYGEGGLDHSVVSHMLCCLMANNYRPSCLAAFLDENGIGAAEVGFACEVFNGGLPFDFGLPITRSMELNLLDAAALDGTHSEWGLSDADVTAFATRVASDPEVAVALNMIVIWYWSNNQVVINWVNAAAI